MRLQPLPENVGTERRVSEVVRQRVPGHVTALVRELIDSVPALTSSMVLKYLTSARTFRYLQTWYPTGVEAGTRVPV